MQDMANILEMFKSIKSFGETKQGSNPAREFAWVLQQAVREDLVQAGKILGDTRNDGLLATSLIYAQRMLEIGYIFVEVFVRDEYEKWQPRSSSPRVIDLGGDPGAMSPLYWKYRAPEARITVVEANPATFNAMCQSLERRGLDDIQMINAAVVGDMNEKSALHLHRPRKGYHTQDYIRKQDAEDVSDGYEVVVPNVKLSTLIMDEERIDLLKVDIEGSECAAMCDLAQSGKLQQVDQVIMEFHQDILRNPGNSLVEILDILQRSGFTIDEAHVTGKGIRGKKKVPISTIHKIAEVQTKVFLTFSATNTHTLK